MYNTDELKEYLVYVFIKVVLPIAVSVAVGLLLAIDIKAERLHEFYFTPPNGSNVTEDEDDVYQNLIESLPDEIKAHMPKELFENGFFDADQTADAISDYSSVWEKITDEIGKAILPALGDISLIFAVVILSSVIRSIVITDRGSNTGQICTAVINAGIALSVVGSEMLFVTRVEQFKNLICSIMNGMIPALAVIYTASGNVNTGAVQSAGIVLLVTLSQNLFTIILMPAVRISLVLAVVDSVFPEIGMKPILTAFKNVATWIMVSSVTLFSFILSLQNTIAQSADSLGVRSMKFAVGNLVPIIGGAVSDSLSTLGGSLSVLKSAGGAASIIALIIVIIPFLISLIMRRLSLFLCKSVAGVLKCTHEEKLFAEFGSITSLMLAFTVAICIAFIYTLTLFTKSGLAVLA